jgi:RNA polymerase-binding transcription factor DksA
MDALTRLREDALERIRSLTAEFDGVVAATADANTDDEHDPEGATIAYERSQLAALLADARSRLAELDHALELVASGRYGTCEVCGRPIPAERLAARPSATRCVQHAI